MFVCVCDLVLLSFVCLFVCSCVRACIRSDSSDPPAFCLLLQIDQNEWTNQVCFSRLKFGDETSFLARQAAASQQEASSVSSASSSSSLPLPFESYPLARLRHVQGKCAVRPGAIMDAAVPLRVHGSVSSSNRKRSLN